MSDTVISVRELGKQYDLGYTFSSGTLRDTLAAGARRLLRRPNGNGHATQREFWALKDVTFDIREGEVVGIIGHNGAGKSTLLKILSGITEPTEGEVRMRGRVGALLEVGTGFHQELSGRENVFMNGAILGMTQAEIRKKFDEIVAFAGVEQFIDTPVKRYSSGMLVRLGFAVAAHLEPEILLVDEVLAVGDAEFQRKCLGKIDEVSKAGRTILFVSHNLEVMQKLCARLVLLHAGRVAVDGTPSDAIRLYLDRLQSLALSWSRDEDGAGKSATIESVALCSPSGDQLRNVTTACDIDVAIQCSVNRESPSLRVAMIVADALGQFVFSTNPADTATPHPRDQGHYRYVVRVPAQTLLPRRYSITVSLYDPFGSVDQQAACIVFDVLPGGTEPRDADYKRPGLVRIPCTWATPHLVVNPLMRADTEFRKPSQ